jgi:hypothetical protein
MKYPYIVQGSQVTVVINGKPHVVSKSHPTFQRVVDAIKAGDEALLESIIDPKRVVLEYGAGNIAIEGDKLFWKGEELHSSLGRRMIQMLQDGFDIKPMVAFMENLMMNPSKTSVDELYGFLEKNSLPLTPDGHFLAYKKVRSDYRDIYSNTVMNKPAIYITDADKDELGSGKGKRNEVTVAVVDGLTHVSMERRAVDDNRSRTCSDGLHFCSRDYLNCFGGSDSRVIIVKINPKDVVSIPSDYDDSKGRTCSYQIVDEIDKEKADEAFAKSVQEAAVREASVLTDAERVEVARLIQEVLNQRKAQAQAAAEDKGDTAVE